MKIIYKMLLFSFLFISCKMSSIEEILPPKKANILERTKWKASGTNEYELDSTLDFYTNNNVTEYIILNGYEITKQGTYKVKGNTVKIKWGKLQSENVSGVIARKEMLLNYLNELKTTKYYKIKEY